MPESLKQGVGTITTSDLYFRYTAYTGRRHTVKVVAFNFDGGTYVQEFPPVTIPADKIRVLRCTCGANNWTDDGRYINDYCCGSCGTYVTICAGK